VNPQEIVQADSPKYKNRPSRQAELQRSRKFVKKYALAKVRQTTVNKGDCEISMTTTYSDPYLTKGDVRVRVPKQPRHRMNRASRLCFDRRNAPDPSRTQLSCANWPPHKL